MCSSPTSTIEQKMKKRFLQSNNSDHTTDKPAIRKMFSPAWIFFLWFGFSVSFFSLIYVTRKDNALSPKEAGLVLALFLLVTLISRFIFPASLLASVRKKEILLASLALSGLCIFSLFSERIRPVFFFFDKIEINLTGLDTETEVVLDWAYWAAEPETPQPETDQYPHMADISFKQLEIGDGWEQVEAGLATTGAENARLTLHTSFFNNNVPVFHFRFLNGGGSLSISDGRETRVMAVQSGAEEVFAVGAMSTALTRTISRLVFLLAFGGILVALWLLIHRLYNSGILPKNIWIRIGSFLIPLSLLLAVCFSDRLYPFGQKTFLAVDMGQIYADMLAYIRTLGAEKNNLLYSFSKNLGGDMLSPYAFYIGNPFNFIVALFPATDLPKVVSWIILIKISLTGLTVSCYLTRKRNGSFSSLIFSTCYALMAYNMVNAENIHFLEGPIFLPLIALGIEKIVEEKRPLLYIFSLFALLTVNFYQGYMACIFAVLFLGFRLLSREEAGSPSVPIKAVLKQFCLASLLAAGGSAFLLAPTFVKLLNGPKSFSASALSLSANFPFFDIFSKLFTGAHNEYEIRDGLPPIFSGILIVILLLLYFMNVQISLKKKWLTFGFFAVLILSFYLDALNLVWHGLNQPVWWNYRNAFIFGFLAIGTAQESFRRVKGLRISATMVCILIFAALSWFIVSRNFPYLSGAGIWTDALLALLFCFLLLLHARAIQPGRHNVSKTLAVFLVALLCFVNLYQNALRTWQVNYGDTISIQEYAEQITQISTGIQRIKVEDNGFYRLEKNFQRGPNDPLQFSYNGLTHYSSTTNPKVLDFLRNLGIPQAHYVTWYAPGTTAAIDMMLGIKYLVVENGQIPNGYLPVFSEDELTVVRNPMALPLGFSAPDNIGDCKTARLDPFALQEQILRCLADGNLGELFTPVEVTAPSGDDPVKWTIAVTQSGPLYAYNPQESGNRIHYETTRNGLFYKTWPNTIENGILPLGSFSPGDQVTLEVRDKYDEYSTAGAIFRYEDLSVLEHYYERLSQEPVAFEKISSSHLRGTYTLSRENRVLFFSIPYEKDWQIWIDGERTQPFEVFGALMAVESPPGVHTIEMKYIPLGLVPGILVSLISWALIAFWSKKRFSF